MSLKVPDLQRRFFNTLVLFWSHCTYGKHGGYIIQLENTIYYICLQYFFFFKEWRAFVNYKPISNCT